MRRVARRLRPLSVRALLLARFRGLLVAVGGAALLLGMAASAGPLFTGSAANGALHRAIDASGGLVPAFQRTEQGDVEPGLIGGRDFLVDSAIRDEALTRPIRSVIGGRVTVGAAGDPTEGGAPSRLVAREGATAHLDVVERADVPGVWLSDRAADALGVHAGDRIVVASFEGRAGARVRGIYADLSPRPRTPYWAPLGALIYPLTPDSGLPPPPLLASRDEFVRITARMAGPQEPDVFPRAEFRWEYGLADPHPSIHAARDLAAHVEEAANDLGRAVDPFTVRSFGDSATPVPRWLEQADRTLAAIRTPVEVISLSARGVALATLALAGAAVVRRRRVEFLVLHARGMRPIWMGARVALEAAGPVLVGAAAGWAAAVALMAALGPGPLDAPALGEAARVAAAAVGIGAVLLAVASGIVAIGQAEEGRRRMGNPPRRVPWEMLPLAGAAAALYEILLRGGEADVGAAEEATVDRLVVLFPLLLVAGGAGLAVRGLRAVAPRLRSVAAAHRPGLYLFTHRMAGAPRTAGVLVTAAAVGAGVLAYAGLESSSIRATTDLKSRVALGSDVAATVAAPVDRSVPGISSTSVVEIARARATPGDVPVAVLGIDPATFQDAAFWDRSFSAEPLAALLGRLAGRGNDSLPVVVAGGAIGGAETLEVNGRAVPITVAGGADGFPGLIGDRPLVVSSAESLRDALDAAGTSLAGARAVFEVWARGDGPAVSAALERAGVTTYQVVTVDDVGRTTGFLSLAWTFGLLEALGVTAGLVALVGVFLYLQSRQRQREVSYVLARRMGLRPREHHRSVTYEIGAMLAVAFAIGATLAFAAALLVYRRYDPLPGLPPGPLLRVPILRLAMVGAAITLAAWAGAWLVQRRADRVDVAEVMRVAA